MNKLLAVLAIMVISMIGITATQATPSKPDLEDKECAAGTYKIAEGICKKEPTGCHLDENTPLDECKEEPKKELPPAPVPQEYIAPQETGALK